MSGGGSSGGGSSTTTTKLELSPEQQQLFNLALPALTEFAGNPPQAFPGQTVAGFDPAQLAGQQTLVNQAQGNLTNLGDSALQASQFFLGPGLDPLTNPFLQSAISAAVQPLFQGLTQSALPAVRGEANTVGQVGSSRQGIAEGLAIQGTQQTAGNVAAGLANQGFQTAMEAGIRALGLAPQTGGLLLQPGGILSAVGAERQGQEQREIDAEVNKFLQEQLLPFLSAKEIASIAFGIPNQSSTASGTTSGGGISPIQGALGGAATGAAIGSLFGPGPGTAIGAGVGAMGGLLGLFG
jgi:hypothetical protein